MIHSLASAWNWSPWVAGICAALLAFYAVVLRSRLGAGAVLYVLGTLLLFAALASPLGILADQYLFTAHVLQSLILLLIVPGLLVLGIPRVPHQKRDEIPVPVKLAVAAWVTGMAALVAWHAPALFDASLRNQSVHILQQASLLIAGAIFWWPVLGPSRSQRLPPVPWSSVYLFAACVVCSLLGLILTYTSAGMHRAYFDPRDMLGILPLIRDTWGFSLETDRETGGLCMWAGGCLICASTVMGLFVVWYNSPEVRDEFSPKDASEPRGRTS